MGRGGGPKIEAIKFAETEMVQTQDAGVAAPVKGLLRRLPLQEWAQAAAEGVPQFLRDAVAAELLVGPRTPGSGPWSDAGPTPPLGRDGP